LGQWFDVRRGDAECRIKETLEAVRAHLELGEHGPAT
jgi:hypothetical protein